MKGSTRERLGISALAALLSVLGCRSLAAPPGAPRTLIETVFVAPDHPLSSCLKGDLGRSYRDQADGVFFFDRDSKLRVTPPSKAGATTYHVHLIHRVGDQSFEFVASQAESGSIELDLSRFDQPEEIIVASAARRISKESPGPDSTLAAAAAREEMITPPYVVSFKLLPAEGQIETLLALQRHRFEIEIDAGGTLTLVVGTLTRRDQLVTFYDPHRKSASLIDEDPYLYVPSQDGAVPP